MYHINLFSSNETTIQPMQRIIDYYDTDMKHIKRSYTLRNGMKDGMFTEYFINGQISSIKEYKGNTLTGKMIHYYENGRLKTSVDYNLKGEQHGKQVIYYPNGNIFKIIQYSNGLPHGKWFSYYDDTNENRLKVRSIEHFAYGKSINKSMTYYDNGNVKSMTNFSSDGRRNGVCKRFFDNQQLKCSKYYVDDKLNGETVEYYRNGNRKRVLYHLEGKLNGTVYKFSFDNFLQFKCHYIDNKRDGYSLEYYTNNTNNRHHLKMEPMLKRAVLYEEGKKNGKAFLYDDKGNLNYIFEYLNDKFHGIQTCLKADDDNDDDKREIKERYMIHNKIILHKRDLFKECSICYESGGTWKTTCGHLICLDCCHKYYDSTNNNNSHGEMSSLKCFYCRSTFQHVNCLPHLIFE